MWGGKSASEILRNVIYAVLYSLSFIVHVLMFLIHYIMIFFFAFIFKCHMMNEYHWWNLLFPPTALLFIHCSSKAFVFISVSVLLLQKSLQTSMTVYLLSLLSLQLTKACSRTRVQASSWSRGRRWALAPAAGTSLQEAKKAAHTWRIWGKPWGPKSTIYCVVKSLGAWVTSEWLRSTRTSEQCGPATKWLLTGK